MTYPIDVLPSGAVRLGPDVACDGFVEGATVRVQTHVHADHMDGFETSKGLQTILLSEATRRLLIAEFDADLPYRSNVVAVKDGSPYKLRDSHVTLIPSGHMLGARQTAVQLADGSRLGYSGDFQWPLGHVIEVDALVVDSTYGAPRNRRRYTQGDCEEKLAALLGRLLSNGPVIVKAHRGTMQRGLQLISGALGYPVIGGDRLLNEVEIYRAFGYTIGPVHSRSSEEAQRIQETDHYVHVYGRWESIPADLNGFAQVTLSAYFTNPDDPVTEYSKNAFAVALSDHADFDGTLEYVKATGAGFVVTDNSRGGNAHDLANAIRDRLGIAARASSGVISGRWGR